MKSQIDSTLNGFIPPLADGSWETPETLTGKEPTILEPDRGWNGESDPQVNQNSQAFGFAFERLQTIGFNISGGLQKSKTPSGKISRKKMTQFTPDVYLEKLGEIVGVIQAEMGSTKSLENSVQSDSSQISGATIIIDIDGVQRFPVGEDLARWVAENPYLAANIMSAAARQGKVKGAGLEAAAIGAIINILLKSIRTLGAYCRGEQELEPAEIGKILEVILAGLKTGCLRGLAVKVVKKLMDGSAFAALGFTVGIEVISTLIRVLKDEMTLEEATAEVDPRMLTCGVITAAVILFPCAGTALLNASVIKGIWEEISPEWKSYMTKMRGGIGSAIATGSVVIAISEVGIIEQNVWQNLGAEKRQAVIEKMKHSTPENVKIAYNMTLEKAIEAFDLASGWVGERTSELAQSIESATPVQIKSASKKILEGHQKKVAYQVA